MVSVNSGAVGGCCLRSECSRPRAEGPAMKMEPSDPPVEFLLTASKNTLQDALLNRMADSSNRQKNLLEMVDILVEVRAQIELIRWFLVHGDELMAAVTSMPTVTEIAASSVPEKPGPKSASDFRETLKSLLESA